MTDIILNGQGHGSVATRLLDADFNVNALRPYINKNGVHCVTVNRFNATKGAFEDVQVPLQNAAATLRYDDWRQLDTAVVKAARYRLRLVSDLRGEGLQYTIPNGLGKQVLTTENMTDPGSATISMDGIRKGEGDRPEFNLVNLPLPIIHSDFSFSLRQIQTSRNSNTPLDTSMAEAAARRCAEAAEQLAIGNYGTVAFAGANVYGIINSPLRITKTMTNPTVTAWTQKTTVTEVLDMKQKSVAKKHFGPWILYTSTAWDQYLDTDYILTGGNVATQTLRERLKKIEGIKDIRALDFLQSYQMVLVEFLPEVIREVVGLDFTTIQWETEGGMKVNFKVMCIMVPQIRADAYGNTGIVHGS